MTRLSPGARIWLAITGGLVLSYCLVDQNSMFAVTLYTSVAAIGTATVLYALAKRPLWPRSAWLLLALGMGLWTSADFLYDTARVRGELSGAPAAYDLLYVAAYVPLIIAVGIFVRESKRNLDSTTLVDSLIVMTAGGVMLLETAIRPMLDNPGFDDSTLFVMTGYLALDLLLLSLTVRLWFSSNLTTNPGVRLLSIALACFLAGDLWYQVGVANSSEPNPLAFAHVAMNLLYLAFFVLAGLAALNPRTTVVPPGESLDRVNGRVRVLVLLGVAVLVPTLMLVSSRDSDETIIAGLILSLVIILGLLMAFRIGSLVDRYADALSRERHLRSATRELTRAQDEEFVAGHIDSFVRKLLDDPRARAVIETAPTETGEGPPPAILEVEPSKMSYDFGVPSTRPRTLRIVTGHTPTEVEAAAMTTLCQSIGMTFDRLDLSSQLVEQRSNARVESLLQHSSDVIALLSASGKVIYVTPAIQGALGRAPEHLVGRTWSTWFTKPNRAERLLQRAGRAHSAQGDMVVVREDGTVGNFDVVATWLPAQQHFVVTHHDVTERHHLQEQLREQAFHDPLTGLYNRAVFREQLGRALRQARRSPAEFVVMMIDLDDFKTINDSLGHPAGDDLLCAVASRLVSCLREGDIAARLGGDEFAVILEHTWTVADAAGVAERILARLSEPVQVGGTDIVLGASIGLAIGNAATGDPDELERNADLALYQSKAAGKRRCTVYETSMHTEAVHRLEFTTELRLALERGEIGVMYQPVVDLNTRALVGLEALARWHHPERGLIQPSEFIGLAEETGLITKLGRQVMTGALTQVAAWHLKYPSHRNTRIAVNLSGRQLGNPELVVEVAGLLEGTVIDPRTVILEITESVLLPGEGVALDRLRGLAELGPSLYIDDFGTGFSSLNSLRSLPVRGVKLAKEFVDRLPSPDEVGFVRAVRELVATLGLEEVVAEGLEHESQRVALAAIGYRLGQGYLFGRPLSPAATEELLAATPAGQWAQTVQAETAPSTQG